MDYFRSEEGNIDFMVRQAFSYIQMCLFCVRVHPSVQIKMSVSNAKGIFIIICIKENTLLYKVQMQNPVDYMSVVR